MSGYNFHGTVTPNTVLHFDARDIETPISIEDEGVNKGLSDFVKRTVTILDGPVDVPVIADFIEQVAECEQEAPLFSARGFKYATVSEIATDGRPVTPEDTILSASRNIELMTEIGDVDLFATNSPTYRKYRAVEWSAPLDDDFEIRMRGGSGAGTFSIDFALGTISNPAHVRFKELWRCGIDTEFDGETGSSGARFIRTGSGVKQGDVVKHEAFDRFRDTYGMLPQKLLGLVGVYAMREMNPDYAIALTTEGALELSTLGQSRGRCDYDGIFASVGFEESPDPHWQVIEDFPDGFFEALDRANLNGREIHSLDMAITALQDAAPTARSTVSEDVVMPITFCSDDSPRTIERELQLYMK